MCESDSRSAGLDSLRRPAIIIARLDPSVGRSGPHDFAVRIGRARLAQQLRPSHPASNVRDDREAPLLWSGMAIIYAELNFWKSEIFLPSGVDTNSENQSVGQISVATASA